MRMALVLVLVLAVHRWRVRSPALPLSAGPGGGGGGRRRRRLLLLLLRSCCAQPPTPRPPRPQVVYPKRTDKPLYRGLVTQCSALGIPFLEAQQLLGQGQGLAGRADVVLDALFGFSFGGWLEQAAGGQSIAGEPHPGGRAPALAWCAAESGVWPLGAAAARVGPGWRPCLLLARAPRAHWAAALPLQGSFRAEARCPAAGGAPRPPFDTLLAALAPAAQPPVVVSVDIPSGAGRCRLGRGLLAAACWPPPGWCARSVLVRPRAAQPAAARSCPRAAASVPGLQARALILPTPRRLARGAGRHQRRGHQARHACVPHRPQALRPPLHRQAGAARRPAGGSKCVQQRVQSSAAAHCSAPGGPPAAAQPRPGTLAGAHHYLGGRFVPPAIRDKHALALPPYHGASQCVRLGPPHQPRPSAGDGPAAAQEQDAPKVGGAAPTSRQLLAQAGLLSQQG
jgi:hypothetical protein